MLKGDFIPGLAIYYDHVPSFEYPKSY